MEHRARDSANPNDVDDGAGAYGQEYDEPGYEYDDRQEYADGGQDEYVGYEGYDDGYQDDGGYNNNEYGGYDEY